jgi:hypothetical protein
MPDPQWTIDDAGNLSYDNGRVIVSHWNSRYDANAKFSPGCFAALVADVRAARAQHPALGQIVDCPGVPGWVHVRVDKLDPLVATARLADDMAAVIRRLEDAVLTLWAEMPVPETRDLADDNPALAEFCRHLHHSIEHEQTMVRRNTWASSEPISPGEVAALRHARQQEPT